MNFKKPLLLLPAVALAGLALLAIPRTHADGPAATSWEYLHLLIPLDRNPDSYRKSDDVSLRPLQDAGADGWELVSANEPAGGVVVRGHASVEFFFKRARR